MLPLTSEDVARYIVSCTNCNNYTLKKLLRKCSAEYYKRYSESLFEHKPFKIRKPLPKSIILKSRLLCSEDGNAKVEIIDKMIEEYKTE